MHRTEILKQQKLYYSKNRLYILEQQRKYRAIPEVIERKREVDREYQRKRRASNPGLKTLEYREYCRKYPERVRAQQIFNHALAKGRIKKSACAKCGAKRVHAHHPDYSKPLDVVFLCSPHHAVVHELNLPKVQNA